MTEWAKYLDLQDEDLPTELSSEVAPDAPTVDEARDLERLAHELHLPVAKLQEIKSLLEDKRQIVLTGPPGTGKTYIARKLAALVAGDESRVEFLQFHPSYTYEDFVEGYRPTTDPSTLSLAFSVEPGPLRDAVRKAQTALEISGEDGAPIYVMVIDEINRANLSRVFGELFFALEYREQSVRLQYSPHDPPLRLPPNLWFIGTMNTADRSIASFDSALRRRFYFVDFDPLVAPFKDVLGSFLSRLMTTRAVDLRWVARLVNSVNLDLPDRRFAVGPSYFLRHDLTEELARRAWQFTVRPYLEDRFGEELDASAFDWDSLVAKAKDKAEIATGLAPGPATVAALPVPTELAGSPESTG